MSRGVKKGVSTSVYLSSRLDEQARKFAKTAGTTRNAVIEAALDQYLQPYRTQEGEFQPVPATHIESRTTYALRTAAAGTASPKVTPCFVLRYENNSYVIGESDERGGLTRLVVPAEQVILYPCPNKEEWDILWDDLKKKFGAVVEDEYEAWLRLGQLGGRYLRITN